MKMERNNISSVAFGSGVHVYFYTDKGQRVLSDPNMRKCIRYMEAHLNASKRVKRRNKDLVDTFMFGQKDKAGNYTGGDKDYYHVQYIRTVMDNTKNKVQGFINVVTGKDAKRINNELGKPVGKAKGLSKRRNEDGSVKSFETVWAVKEYKDKAHVIAESNPIIKDGKRRAFGIVIKPTKVDKNGKIVKFDYVRSGYFDEVKVNKNIDSKK